MKKNIMLCLLFLVIVCVLITGCSKKENGIVGSWANSSYVYTFNKDNTCSYDTGSVKMECTYEIDGEKISILYKGNTEPFKTTYSIDGNKLNVKDSLGRDTIYIKK